MLENLLTVVVRFIIAVVFIGLAIALFFIGIIALWYLLLIGTVLWIARRIYRAWQTRHSGPIRAGDVEIIIHEETHQKTSRSGRIIDHE